MANTTPNKEAVRRICLLHKTSFCYLLSNNKTEFVELLSDISDANLPKFNRDLESWCGMKFKVFNASSKEKHIQRLKTRGDLVYPLE